MMHIQILGTRGIPSHHGGFETFAQDLALHLAGNGHRVTVYCQAETGERAQESVWRGIRLIHIPAPLSPVGTMKFDLQSVLHSCREEGIALTLGYNTAIFSLFYRLCRHKNVMNMDGLEWRREKWSVPAKLWLQLNEWLGARFANHLIADHPEIAKHLARHTRASRITVIPYGSVVPAPSPPSLLDALSLKPGEYDLVIARPEPENSICEIVRAFSMRRRATELIILGRYLPDLVPYHAMVMRSAGQQVRFVGPVYDRELVSAMRMHARSYLHGHRVGGTNPSLVEAMACANPIIAHDNAFNRWVAGKAGIFFRDVEQLDRILTRAETDPELLQSSATQGRLRHREHFDQYAVLSTYEQLLQTFLRRDRQFANGESPSEIREADLGLG